MYCSRGTTDRRRKKDKGKKKARWREGGRVPKNTRGNETGGGCVVKGEESRSGLSEIGWNEVRRSEGGERRVLRWTKGNSERREENRIKVLSA